MSENKWRILSRSLLAGVALLGLVSTAEARTPRDLSDLVGARAAGAENALYDRGYEPANVAGLTAYWWNEGSGTCVKVVTSNGRYASVSSTGSRNCGTVVRHDNAAAGVAAGIAVGAAALLLNGVLNSGQQQAAPANTYQQPNAGAGCPLDVSQADRYLYPDCN